MAFISSASDPYDPDCLYCVLWSDLSSLVDFLKIYGICDQMISNGIEYDFFAWIFSCCGCSLSFCDGWKSDYL